MDLKAIKPYRILIKEVGQRYCIDPAIIAAIISRESHGGVVLQNGWDHRGQKFGLMQVDSQTFHQPNSISPCRNSAQTQSPYQDLNTRVPGLREFGTLCSVTYLWCFIQGLAFL